jgi:hypothetical protein
MLTAFIKPIFRIFSANQWNYLEHFPYRPPPFLTSVFSSNAEKLRKNTRFDEIFSII